MKTGTIAAASAAAAALAAIAALGDHAVRPSIRVASTPSGRASASGSGLSAPCPPGALPDDGVCIPVPAAPRISETTPGIPLRAGRETDYGRYELPVAAAAWSSIEPNAGTGSGSQASSSALSIHAPPGTPVSVVTLEGQDGPANVVYSGPLVRESVVTLHAVRDHGRPREYLVVVGNLRDARAPAPHSEAARNTPLGAVDSVPLYLDVRLVRAGTDVWALPPEAFQEDANTIAVDPRNVLRPLP